ncbi:MAG: cytochrome [Tardiphaga sp.]|jgi:cytochrome c|nr:cytochrome [Tardiphaga sp.]
MRSVRFSRSWPVWTLVGFVAAGAAVAAVAWSSGRQAESAAIAMAGGDPARAPAIIRRYGCAGCHTIPGIPGGDGQVGGPLADIKHRVYVGGVVTNAPDHLVQWIVAPQHFSPRTAMPATGISEAEARDVATFLYSR